MYSIPFFHSCIYVYIYFVVCICRVYWFCDSYWFGDSSESCHVRTNIRIFQVGISLCRATLSCTFWNSSSFSQAGAVYGLKNRLASEYNKSPRWKRRIIWLRKMNHPREEDESRGESVYRILKSPDWSTTRLMFLDISRFACRSLLNSCWVVFEAIQTTSSKVSW